MRGFVVFAVSILPSLLVAQKPTQQRPSESVEPSSSEKSLEKGPSKIQKEVLQVSYPIGRERREKRS